MKVVENCKRPECKAKNSMVRIVADGNRKKKRLVYDDYGSSRYESYDIRDDITAFYICKKCTWISHFNSRQWPTPKTIFNSSIWFFDVCLSKNRETLNKIRHVEKKRKIPCLRCGKLEIAFPEYEEKRHSQGISYLPTGKEIFRPAVVKLYVKKGRKFIGYYCRFCKLSYFLPLQVIDWYNPVLAKLALINKTSPAEGFDIIKLETNIGGI